MKINRLQKLGKIKYRLQTLNEKFQNTRNRFYYLCQKISVVFFYYLNNFNERQRIVIIVFLQKYNHLQPPGVADFFHGGRNY